MTNAKRAASLLLSAMAAMFSFGTRAEKPSRPYRQILEIRYQGGWKFRTAHASHRFAEAGDRVAKRHASELAEAS